MTSQCESVWVSVELEKVSDEYAFRGLMAVSDFDALIDGSFNKRFVAIDHTHWIDTVYDAAEDRNLTRIVAPGHGSGKWSTCTGTYFLRVDRILSVALVEQPPEFSSAKDV